MTNPERYRLAHYEDEGVCDMHEYDDGEWVKWTDYEVLRGNLTLAEEGLANYALEVQGLRIDIQKLTCGDPGRVTNPMDRGDLWSFLRSCLSQGGDIWLDHKEKSFEEYSARMDAAARERVPKLMQLLSGKVEAPSDEPGVCGIEVGRRGPVL